MANEDDHLLTSARLDDATVKSMLEVVRKEGVVLKNWWILGQPTPEAVEGVVEVAPAKAPEVIEQMLTIPKLRTRIDVFPVGIVRNDVIQIRFKGGAFSGVVKD